MHSEILIERQKYEDMFATGRWWSHNDPGMIYLQEFVDNYAKNCRSITDFGCGSGEAAMILSALGYSMIIIDIARNCLSEWPKRIFGDRFICCALHEIPKSLSMADWGYCTDVMEHIPEKFVEDSFSAMRQKARNIFFSICGRPDRDGAIIGEILHVTIRPMEWWIRKINNYWKNLNFTGEGDNFIIVGFS